MQSRDEEPGLRNLYRNYLNRTVSEHLETPAFMVIYMEHFIRHTDLYIVICKSSLSINSLKVFG